MHDMDWDNLRVFLAIARAGRISGAARELGVEHTTVGRRLAALEEQLGVGLFYRTAAGYRLTGHGERILASAEAMDRTATEIRARAREGSGALAGRVRVAMIEELAAHWLAPALPGFRAAYPGIDLQVLVGIRPVDLARGEAELAIRTPRPRQAGLAAVRLARPTTTGLYASRALLGGRRLRVRDVASLRGLPLAIYTAPYHALQAAAWFQPVLDAATVVLTTDNSETLLAAARAGVAVAVLPRLLARGAADLVAVSDDLCLHDQWLVTHPEFRRDPSVRAVGELLRAAADGPTGLC